MLRVSASSRSLCLVRVRLGVGDHPLHLVLGQAGAALDPDLLLVAGAEILGVDVDDPVRVDVEADLDLRHPSRRRRDADELELAERLVVGRHLRLALEHVDLDRGLVVLGGRERLRLPGRDRRVRSISFVKTPPLVSIPRLRGVTSSRSTSLTSPLSTPPWIAPTATTSSGLTPLCGSLPSSSFLLLHRRRRVRADQDDMVDPGCVEPGVGECLLGRADGAGDEIGGDLAELRTGQLQVEVLRAVLGGGDEGRLICVVIVEESSIFAFSAAS